MEVADAFGTRRQRPALALLLCAGLAACGTVTYVAQKYDGDPRPRDTIAIFRITPTDRTHVSSIDGEPVDVQLASDTRMHIELLPGTHDVGMYEPPPGSSGPVIARHARFEARAGTVYKAALTPQRASVYEIDDGSGAVLRDATTAAQSRPR